MPPQKQISDGQEWEVICAAITYFEAERAKDAAGNARETVRGGPMLINTRHSAHMGEIVKLSASEAQRLLNEGAIQVPNSAPLPGGPGSIPQATPFSVPVAGGARFDGHPLGDPRPPAEVVGKPLPTDDRSAEPEPEDPDELDLDVASAEEIARWIEADKPEPWTEKVMVEAASDDPELAQKLLDAENIATNGTPRKGVEKQLKAIFAEPEE